MKKPQEEEVEEEICICESGAIELAKELILIAPLKKLAQMYKFIMLKRARKIKRYELCRAIEKLEEEEVNLFLKRFDKIR